MAKNITFHQPAAELIKKRFSCRSFDGRGLESKTLEALEKFPAALELPFQSRLRFGVIDGEKVKAKNMFSTGSYGMIKGARFYLSALVCKEAPRPWEDIGFALEAMVLYATDLDLGSCWIGGIFDRRNFGRALGMEANELLPAVVAVGHAAAKPSLRDRLVRWSAKGNLRKAPGGIFFAGDWQTPLQYEELPQWAPVLECVRLAPSASNKQPWRIIFRDGSFHFFLNRDRAYSAMMPKADLQRIDMGIAICHFQLTAAEAGLKGEWTTVEPQIPNTPGNFEYIAGYLTEQ
jgi:nitroreductase